MDVRTGCIAMARKAVRYALMVTQNPIDKRASARAAYIALKLAFKALNSEETPVDLMAEIKTVVERLRTIDRSYYYRARKAYLDWLVFHRYWEGRSLREVQERLTEYVVRVARVYMRMVDMRKADAINALKLVFRVASEMGALVRTERLVRFAARLSVWVEGRVLGNINGLALQRFARLVQELRRDLHAIGIPFGVSKVAEARLRRAYNEYMRQYMRQYRRNGPKSRKVGVPRGNDRG